ncbi:MAG: SagB family peptide dehydrogenase [Vicinamibacterales bacterium]
MQTADRYRRAPGLVIYWAGSQAVCFIWQSCERIPISMEAAGLLQEFSDWTSLAEFRDRVAPGSELEVVAGTIGLLHTLRLVEREGDVSGDGGWQEWSPEAAFFHFSTKNGMFPEDLGRRDRELVAKAAHDPQPAPTKHVDGPRHRLPNRPLVSLELQASLNERRTWRRFSDQAVPCAALGTVLAQTFGVSRRAAVAGQGPVILRRSPSGGSRHPIEAYLLAWNVDGLKAGAYHYDSETLELVDLGRSISSNDIAPLLAHQTYFRRAGAVVVMCPVFARTMWRYGHSRAYRTVLLDAGHLGQTFCLVATALGLAPFTTMAFSESGLEQLLGLDGVRECPIYVAGVGMPDPAASSQPGKMDFSV